MFNFSIRYIDDILSLKISRFGEHLHLIYPNELEVKDTIDTQKSASYPDLLILESTTFAKYQFLKW
jgi:hypothetical protein